MRASIFRICMGLSVSFLPVSCLNDKLGDRCEATYYSTVIKPFIITKCANTVDCHLSSGTAADLTKYSEVFKNKDDIIRRISLDPSNNEFMPKGSPAVSPAELQMLKDWISSGAKGCDN